MTHIKMLKEMAKKYGEGVYQLCYSRQHKTWRVGNVAGGEVGDCVERDTPEEAIEEAFNKLFPLIPASVGVGDEEWMWVDNRWQSKCHAVAHTFRNRCGRVVYAFGMGITSESNGEVVKGQPQYITAAAMRGFLKLIKVTPKLEPPTEE